MNILTLYLYLMSYVGVFFVTYMVVPIDNRCRLFRKIKRANYGIMEVMRKGGAIDRQIVDFSQDTAPEGYIIDPAFVYRKEGLPCIHFNERDIEAIDFKPADVKGVDFNKDDPHAKYRDPKMIRSIFMKQKALVEAKSLFDDKRIWTLIMIIVVMSTMSAVLGYMSMNMNNEKVIPQLTDIKSHILNIANKGDGTITIGNTSYPILK